MTIRTHQVYYMKRLIIMLLYILCSYTVADAYESSSDTVDDRQLYYFNLSKQYEAETRGRDEARALNAKKAVGMKALCLKEREVCKSNTVGMNRGEIDILYYKCNLEEVECERVLVEVENDLRNKSEKRALNEIRTEFKQRSEYKN